MSDLVDMAHQAALDELQHRHLFAPVGCKRVREREHIEGMTAALKRELAERARTDSEAANG